MIAHISNARKDGRTKHDDYSLRVHYVTSGYSAIVVANRAVVHYVLNSPRHGYVYD